jgi:acyl-coenzyme A thioesterase PaaI-like protein
VDVDAMTKIPSGYLLDPSMHVNETPDVMPPRSDNWRARRELADALRKLNTALLTSVVPTEQLDALTAMLSSEVARIESNTRVYGRLEFLGRETTDAIYEMGPAFGQSNAVSIPMHVWTENGKVHGTLSADWSREGPFGHLHGGVIALLFDQFLGIAQRTVKGTGRTATLSISYHHPTPLNQPLRMLAEVSRVDGRKKFVTGGIWVGELLTASCEGLFISSRDSV